MFGGSIGVCGSGALSLILGFTVSFELVFARVRWYHAFVWVEVKDSCF